MTTVVVGGEALAAMVAHAAADDPREACGLLAMSAGRVVQAIPTPNSADTTDRFLIEPSDHHAALVRAEAMGWELVGVYHSHPAGPSVPSETDVSEGFDCVSMIVAPIAGQWSVQAFRIVAGSATELVISTDPSDPLTTLAECN